ncbi:HIRAN domain-containing protein [Mumia qirimensis]|uniref:HIRAN domain-containing protein n=1 Tax=Mumia qirimensis TaxID=3234852 RepID=UPI00351D0A7A
MQDLLVLWQHPATREIIPIGRFARLGSTYRFVYTRAAAAIEGFRPLPGLNDLTVEYVSENIPLAFAQRVMEPDRPDFSSYARTLGLDPARATPWEQIVSSGGARAGDTLQFMQVPVVSSGRAIARFLANGVRHIPEVERNISGRLVAVSLAQQESALRRLRAGHVLTLEEEHSNPTDKFATLVTSDGVPVGWVPRALSASVRELIEAGPTFVTVVRVGEPGSPAHLRLVLELDMTAPEGFEFDRAGAWEPIVG